MKHFFTQKRNQIFFSLLLAGFLCFVILSLFLKPVSHGNSSQELPREAVLSLKINEVCSINPGTDRLGETTYEDYLELYNPTGEDVSLKNLYLSDNRKTPYLYALPEDAVVKAYSYYLIYGDSLPFGLSGNETVMLSYNSKDLNRAIDSVSVPVVTAGAVYARTEDGKASFAEMRPSPGSSNRTASMVLESPAFSLESGFYKDSKELNITSAGDIPIYYTLDGSEPTEDSLLYRGPVPLTDPSLRENVYSAREDIAAESDSYLPPSDPVDKAVIVRAACIDEEGNYSNTVTASYFIGFEEKAGYEDAAVISLVTDPANLFDEEKGIYTRGNQYTQALEEGIIHESFPWIELMDYMNYYMEGPVSERQAHLSYFDSTHTLSLSQECGIRIRGNESRSFPQKSFTLFSRKRYESGAFAPVFFDSGISYPDLILNNGKKLRKVFFFSLVEDRSPATQKYLPCQVFLNGEYWGMYYLMEKYSAEYLEGHYGIDTQNSLLIKATREVQDGNPEDISRFKELRNYLDEADFSNPEAYEKLLKMMDMQSFIDWMCTNIYIANTDTKPLDGNVFTWQSTNPDGEDYNDGRWRWMLYDLDDSLGVGIDIPGVPAYAIDSFTEHAGYAPSAFLDDKPMPALMVNEEFRKQFVLTFMDMANENFRAERVSAMLDDIYRQYAEMADKSYERWYAGTEEETLEEQTENLREFFNNRYESIVPRLAEHFALEGDLVSLTLTSSDPEAGTICLNTLHLSPGEEGWTGNYYTDYPITLTAEAANGYSFVKWEISGGELTEGSLTDETIQVKLSEEGAGIHALFQKDSPWSLN